MLVAAGRVYVLDNIRGDFVFVEYSYNSSIEDEYDVFERLSQLGFSLRSKHNFNPVTFWSQQTAILMVRDNPDIQTGCVTGLGLVTSKEGIVTAHEAEPCRITDFFKINFPVMGFNIYLLQESELSSLTETTYSPVNETHYKTKGHGLYCFTGIEFDSDNERLKGMLEKFGFTDDSEGRSRFVSANKSFTALFRHKGNNKAVSIIGDTQDIFKTTASLSVAGVKFLKIDQRPEGFKDLTHKIVGYDCAVFGNYNTHSIEKYIPPADSFNTNLIVRQRKQFTKLDDSTFEYYDTVRESQEG